MKCGNRIVVAGGLVVGLLAATAQGAYIFNGTNFLISEDFNLMPTSNVSALFSGTVGVQSIIPGTGFEGAKIGGSGTAATSLLADAGGSGTGSVFSYGALADPERALGMIASGTNVFAQGFALVNGGSTTITQVTVSFNQENWRSSTSSTGTPNTLQAAFGTTDSGVLASSFLSTALGFTDADMLDMVGPTPVVTNGALNGNDPLNQVGRTFTFTGLDVGPGESFYVRWQDFNDQGNDAGIAIDQCRIEIVPTPGSLALLAFSALAMPRRRR